MVVAGGSENFLNTVAYFDNGYIECTAAEVIYNDLLVVFLVYAVCKCRCRRLIDYSVDFETRDLTGILCSLSL